MDTYSNSINQPMTDFELSMKSQVKDIRSLVSRHGAKVPSTFTLLGQLILKCPDEKRVSSKIPTKLFLDFCPEIFCSFLGGFLEAFWASWGLNK